MFRANVLHATGLRFFQAAMLLAAAGCGAAEDQGSASEAEVVQSEASAVTGTVTISCPSSTRASWIQAANGTVDLIAGQTKSFGAGIGGPTTTLECGYSVPVTPQILDHTVQLGAGTVDSACGAKATFSGAGQQIGGVPPFGGWQFKSGRVTAFSTYTAATGACRLQIPVVGPPSTLKLRVTQGCTPINNGYRCPASVAPVN